MQSENKKASMGNAILGNMSPGMVFLFGIIQGVLVLCTIGFFIMLAVYFGNGKPTKVSGTNPTNPTVQPSNPTGGEPTGPIAFRPVDEDEDHIRGDKNAPVTIIEYSDFECPFCSRFTPTIDQVLNDYDGEVRVVYRHFPLRSIHPQAAPAALAAECAAEQGKFWEYHDELFKNQASLTPALYTQLATQLGLNVSKFDSCVSSNKYASRVQADETDAQNAGGQGTPYSVVVGPNGETVPLSGALPFASVKTVLDQFVQ
ncbi:MAG: thioredoxin domain-containing protein [Candidatus Magasanikbacteria bacterium]|nr:thioredoxin domain-containing protein [Candidatus Magasanikbacteria bacterium]